MDELHNCNTEQKKPEATMHTLWPHLEKTQERLIYSVTRQDSGYPQRSPGSSFWVLEVVCLLSWALVSQVCSLMKIHCICEFANL